MGVGMSDNDPENFGYPSHARWIPEFKEVNGVTITVTQPEDPAYALLLDDFTSTDHGVFNDKCYICLDPEFKQMGLPLCYKCEACGGHVPADDTICTDCDADAQELYCRRMEAECAEKGHDWVDHESYSYRIFGADERKVEPAWTSCERCSASPS